MKKTSTQWLVALALILSANQVFAFAEPGEDSSPITQDPNTTASTTLLPPGSSPLGFGLDFQFIPARYPGYLYTPVNQSNQTGLGGRIGFEWLPLANRFGKGGVGMGAGYTKISGVDIGSDRSSLESIPVDVYATYRFDYLTNQPIVPFVKGGVERHYVRQKASSAAPHYTGWNASFGVAILLDWIDSSSAQKLDVSTGINNTYLTVEYLVSRNAVSANAVNLARDEVRLGLRFEM